MNKIQRDPRQDHAARVVVGPHAVPARVTVAVTPVRPRPVPFASSAAREDERTTPCKEDDRFLEDQ